MELLRAVLVCASIVQVISEHVTTPPSKQKVVVIGAGIGGGAFSHYWSKMHPSDDLMVFESRDYIGGRLKHVNLHGHTVELGGDAWSTAVNQYVVELAKEFGSELSRPWSLQSMMLLNGSQDLGDPIHSSMGVWQGDHIEPIGKQIRRQPLSDIKAAIDESEFIWRLRQNYHQRGGSKFFHSIEEFLEVSSLDKYTTSSSNEFFSRRNPFSTRHISPELLQFALEPLSRVIYDQNLSESHAFASLVAATAAIGAASFEGGNSLLVEKLLSASGAEVSLRTRVTSVTYRQESGSYTVHTCHVDGLCSSHEANVVILACPIEHADISFTPQIDIQPREWRHWYVTVTRARGLNPVFFGTTEGRVLQYDNILTTENSSATIPFNVLQLEADLGDGTSLWKFFSNSDISEKLRFIFTGWSEDPMDTIVQHWPYTFPILHPVPKGGEERYQPIVLAPGLLHLNTMESVASAMEGSIIAARNAALLLTKSLSVHDALFV